MSGYCAIGRVNIAASPASTITIERTVARIGLRINVAEITSALSVARCRALRRLVALRGFLAGQNPDFCAGRDFQQTLNDDAITGIKALGYDPGVLPAF